MRTKRASLVVVALGLSTAMVIGGIALATPVKRVASLNGNFEGGDPNASGRAVLRIDRAAARICFRITFEKMVEPTYGAILKGSADTNYGNELKITLFNGDQGGRSSPITGCARNLPRDVLKSINKHPRRFFVQIDQHVYENAVLRGEIRRPN